MKLVNYRALRWALVSVSLFFAAVAFAGSGPPKYECHRGADCEDGNPCTTHFCAYQSPNNPRRYCQAPSQRDVRDWTNCTIDACNPATGAVTHTWKTCEPTPQQECKVAGRCTGGYRTSCTLGDKPNGTACGNANSCGMTGACQNGACVGSNPVVVGIEFESRRWMGGNISSTAEAIAAFNALPAGGAGYGRRQVDSLASWSNHSVFGGGSTSNLAYHTKFGVNVTDENEGVWGFRLGPDFGGGGTIVVDGVEIASRWSDMWWNGSFNDPNQSLTAYVDLAKGLHIVELYGFEGCCDGQGTLGFTAPGGSTLWTHVSKATVDTCAP